MAEPNPKLVQKTDMRAGKATKPRGDAAPGATPRKPPITVRVMAGRVNCKRITCRLVAALRTPLREWAQLQLPVEN